RPGIAVRARSVLDEERLPEYLGEPFGEEPRGDIEIAAGHVRDDDSHRLLRIALRERRRRGGDHDQRADEAARELLPKSQHYRAALESGLAADRRPVQHSAP